VLCAAHDLDGAREPEASMRNCIVTLIAGVLSVGTACASDDANSGMKTATVKHSGSKSATPGKTAAESAANADADPGTGASSIQGAAGLGGAGSSRVWDPPAAPAGYTRIEAPTMENLEPGSDVMYCQYVHAPFDRDLDVLDVSGHQSLGGHHSVAYATTMSVPVGTSRPCNNDDNLASGFLGGTGGEGGASVKLPEGMAFRLPKGNSIMLNTHFLNTTENTIDGYSVLDFKFAEVDQGRMVAGLFSNGNVGFKLEPKAETDALAACKMKRDMQFIMFTNHMHDQGSHAKTELEHADGRVELVHEDPTWSFEMQFNASYSVWTVAEPLTVYAGETLRTSCHWRNATDAEMAFPREMCFGVGFFVSDGTSSPVCLDGSWLDR
jgi:hypothetical protein